MRDITRRDLALLLGKTLMAAPAIALRDQISEPAAAAESSFSGLPQRNAPVYIVLWFDTEDYILPASDDAAKRIATFLSDHGIRATFKVVGEKARVLEKRNRADVIAALARQEIGYHSNTHSQHPTVAEYESVLDWELGAEEFDRRERPGFDDVRRIFGKTPTCYGQPGVSWAPQAYPALKKWGVHVYLDDGEQVQLEGKPFWYGGLLNIFGINAGRQLEPNDAWSNLQASKDNFNRLYSQLSAQPPGGLVSFMFHPTQLISQKFWDAVNFAQGANPAPSEWKLQPERSAAEREQAFKYFEGLILYIKSFPGVRFITASEAFALYRDTAQGRPFGREEIGKIARQVTPKINFQLHEGYVLSASEVFALLNAYVVNCINKTVKEEFTLDGTPYGPSSPAPEITASQKEIPWSQFSRTVLDVQAFLERTRSIPNAVWFGSIAAAPEDYLLALAGVAQALLRNRPEDPVTLLPAEVAATQWVAQDSISLWDWPIFPPGFHSSHLMDLARLQAWTLKPALLRSNGLAAA